MVIIYFFKLWIHPSHVLRVHLQALLQKEKKKIEKAVLSIYLRGDLFHLFICLFIYLFDLYSWVQHKPLGTLTSVKTTDRSRMLNTNKINN